MTCTNKLCLTAVAAIVALWVGIAFGQDMRPGISLHPDSRRPLDPGEEEKRKAVDDAYKSTMEKIPDQKKSNDPWGNIRSTTTSSKQR
jgi:hypothetical protein